MDAQRNALEIKKACEAQSLYHIRIIIVLPIVHIEAKLEKRF